MVISDSEIFSHEEAESSSRQPPENEHQARNNNVFSSLGRQNSIYSLTLDEFQHTLIDGGKNFGSMNMDEFLNSIWTAEENQIINPPIATNFNTMNLSLGDAFSEKPILRQSSLARQGSLTLPPPLCRKTVEEVWSEIHRSQKQLGRRLNTTNSNSQSVQSTGSAHRQPTFGDMTLEDFLVKAGVVREQSTSSIPEPVLSSNPQQYGLYHNSNSGNHHPSMSSGPTFNVSRAPMVGMAIAGSGERNGSYHGPPVCYTGRMGNGVGYGPPPVVETAVTSSVSPDSQVESGGANMFEVEIGGSRGGGRKRSMDGPVEKVVERRQRRMIKNRESAARSRARKQAYTVELEAELNQLREENSHLKLTLAELERKRKQQCIEEMKMKTQTRAQKNKERLRLMGRSSSCPL